MDPRNYAANEPTAKLSDVRFESLADITARSRHVRVTLNNIRLSVKRWMMRWTPVPLVP